MSGRAKKKRLYFAHSMSTYGTPRERRALKLLRSRYPNFEIVNPGAKRWQKHVEFFYPLCGMGLFDLIAARCDLVAAMPFAADGAYGAGVYSEILSAHRAGVKLVRVNPDAIAPLDFTEAVPLSVARTRYRIKVGTQ